MEPAPPRAVRRLRFAGTAVLVVAGACFALLLTVRFVVFPRVEAHRADIAALLSARLGQTVAIDSIAASWDGWNPRVSIRGLSIRDKAGLRSTPLLELPSVDLIVSWTSLPLADFRLRELIVDGPRLSVRRDPQGRLRVAGIALDPDQPTDDSTLAEWLLRQREIVVQNALIVWDDELRNAPQLVLDQVQFRLERTFGHHRFGLTGTPPAELAGPMDLRGDIVGLDPADWQKVEGRFYLRLDYADIAAWREWLSLPLPVESGKGALRLWVDVVHGQPRDVVADLELADVDTQLDGDLPRLALRHVAGRIGWKRDDAHRSLFTRALTFETDDGTRLAPTDLTLALDDARADSPAQGRLAFPRLDLAPLAAIAGELPLPAALRRDLARYAPRGTLIDGKLNWEGPAEAPRKFAASAVFERVGLNAQDLVPGVDGLSGSFDASETKGTLKLASHALTLDAPRIFAEPLPLESITGSVRWEKEKENDKDTMKVSVSDLVFANAHGAGTASGTWHTLPAGPGAIDLRAQLSRINVENVYRYLPVRLSEHVRDWTRRALVKGSGTDGKLVLNGNLADFPFAQGKGGQFLFTAKAQNVTVDYAERWPALTDADGDVRFEGAHLTVDATGARVLGGQVTRARAEIVDVHDPQPVLRFSTEVTGPVTEFLAFVARSPLAESTGHFTDRMQATGAGRLALKFDLPLKHAADTTVAAEFQVQGGQVKIGTAPPLSQVNGKLAFNETSLTGTDVAAEVFGGPVTLQLAGSGNKLRVNGSGSTPIANLRGEMEAAFADRVAGTAAWQVQIDARPDGMSWVLESSLKGVAIDLPAPLGKSAEQASALRVERKDATPARRDETLVADYDGIARLVLRGAGPPETRFDRALLVVGKGADKAGDAERPGLWVRASLPSLNVDDWLAVGRVLAPAGGTPGGAGAPARGFALEGADLEAASLQALGRKFNDMKIVARRNIDDWRLSLDGREVAGTAVWRAPTPIMPNGRVVARLARLTTPDAGDLVPWKAPAVEAAGTRDLANPWPEIDLATDVLLRNGHDIGKLDVTARPTGADWRIESLALVNDAGSIHAQGWWRAGPPQQTRLDLTVETQEAGAFLARFGMADAIRGAPTKIDGQLAWAGAPSDFDYPSLSGSFKLESGAGQFLKADPGVGRLLGVLSLQALPRRITLDFRDVFSEGYAFDTIVGSGAVEAGIMSTENLRLVGPAANVDISGSVDLARETEQLRVRVLPSLTTGISAGAAALFIANPLVGAAVGAGTLLAQKLLKDPFEQLFSYDYAVSGSWTDPVVQRVGGRTAAAPAQAVAR